MAWELWSGPVALCAAGLAILVGLHWFRFRTRSGEADAICARLDEEKREVARLLDEARRTTERLERMIDTFERTFYAGEGPNGSVAAVFESLHEQSANECRVLAERTETMRRRFPTRTLTKTAP